MGREQATSRLTGLVAVLAGVLAAAFIPLLNTSAAAATTATESYARPSSGVFDMSGHGWGHGHGLSQWGADGAAAKKGLTGPQIAAFYYPNTTQAYLKDTTIRVLLDCQPGLATCGSSGTTHPTWPAALLSAVNGLVMVDQGAATPTAVKLPTDRSQWKVTVASDGYHLFGLKGSTWSAYPTASTLYKGPLDLSSASGTAPALVRVNYSATTGVVWREYRGTIRVNRSTTTTVRLVNRLGLESYLLGVVPRESPASWPHNALFAQAIAARSYSAYERAHTSSSSIWDICDTTWCQVYWGTAQGKRASDGTVTRIALEQPSTTKAVRCYATYYPKSTDPAVPSDPCSAYTGPIMRSYGTLSNGQPAPIFAQFSSSNGGWSTKTDSPDTSVQKYLVAQRDPYDGLVASSVHSWSDSVAVSTLERSYLSGGKLKQIRISRDNCQVSTTTTPTGCDWGGRVTTVYVDGTNASGAAMSVTVSGSSFKSAAGLLSNWFKPATTTTSPTPTASPSPSPSPTPPPAPTISGPATASRAMPVTISGTTAPGTKSVTLWRLNQNTTSWTSVALTPDSAGKWSAVWRPTVDVQYYAAVGTQRTTTRKMTVTGTTISGPTQVTKNTSVVTRGYAAPNAKVTVCWRRGASTSCTATTTVTSSSTGYWASNKVLETTYTYYATAASVRSPVITTKVV